MTKCAKCGKDVENKAVEIIKGKVYCLSCARKVKLK